MNKILPIIHIDRRIYRDKGAWEGVLFYYIAFECSGRVLNMGSGDGELVSIISGLYGLDIVGYNDNLVKAPFLDNSFDSIVIAGILEDSEAPDKILKEAHRLCHPDGKIIISAAKETLALGQKRSFTGKSLEELVEPYSREINWKDEVKGVWFVLTFKPKKEENVVDETEKAVLLQKGTEKQPLVSVIIPTYNREKYIGKAIQSVLDQTYGNYEILIIDDGSTDNTKKVVDSFNSEKIRYFRKEHSGISDARNYGIRESKGEYISWLDSDDEYLPNLLAFQQSHFEANPLIEVLYVDHYFMDSKGKIDYCCYDYTGDSRQALIAVAAMGNSPTRNMGSMVRKNIYEKIGGYDPLLKMAEDTSFTLRALNAGVRFKHLPLPLCKRRNHNERTTFVLRKDHLDEAKALEYLVNNFKLSEMFPDFSWGYAPKDGLEAKAYCELGKRFYEKKCYPTAIDYFKLSLEKNKSPGAHYGLGLAYLKIEDDNNAEKNFIEALNLGSEESDVFENLCYLRPKYIIRFLWNDFTRKRINIRSKGRVAKYYFKKMLKRD
ncbi:MAG: glycosyltransferase [bacterium]